MLRVHPWEEAGPEPCCREGAQHGLPPSAATVGGRLIQSWSPGSWWEPHRAASAVMRRLAEVRAGLLALPQHICHGGQNKSSLGQGGGQEMMLCPSASAEHVFLAQRQPLPQITITPHAENRPRREQIERDKCPYHTL